ncbi:MAG TPA: prepilin-type N-terminal cleavage/methylation domain-containing protein [Candidatus Baltobacteraceae bacterium]|nr:prepilin-type N-terminal cleavage/methylation domain-containing protein [Candidatus Baltobacteraceae bacterium]
MKRQAGFTLLETLVGAAIAAVILWSLIAFADRAVNWAVAANRRLNAGANAARLVERLSSEAEGAWAVYVPAADAFGRSNADGHELDFFAEDGAHRTYSWSYDYDASAQTLTRYALVAGNAPVAGDVLADIDGFVASPQTLAALAERSSPAYDPLFASAAATDVPYAFAAMPGAIGGNRLVAVTVVASGVDRSVVLASEDAPTAFTVVVNYTPSPAPLVTPTVTPLTLTP